MDIADIAAAEAGRTASNASRSALSADFDTFLTLLTTQLQNQDPLDPLDTDRFTEQLVQFAGVEQSIETNAQLGALIDLQAAAGRAGAAAFIGEDALIETPDAHNAGDGVAWRIDAPSDAETLTLRVISDNGEFLAEYDGAPIEDFVWDGRSPDGARAATGRVRLEASASTAGGETTTPSVRSLQRVEGVDFTSDDAAASPEPRLVTAAGAFDLSSIIRIGAGAIDQRGAR